MDNSLSNSNLWVGNVKLLLQTDLKYRDSYWVLQTREHLAKMSDITGRRLSREESIVNETEEKLKSETT